MKVKNAVLLLLLAAVSCGGDSNGNGIDAVCGNGMREFGEECDDGNIFDGDFCTHDCKRPGAICGNGIRESTEECDDGNLENGDGCDFTCFKETTLPDGETAGDVPDVFPDTPPVDGIDGIDLAPDYPTEWTDAVDLCIDRTCPEVECDLWDQTGCAFAEKCSIDGMDRICVPAGTYTEGQRCLDETECGVGLSCLTNGSSDKLCFRFCRDDFDCFGTGSLCVYDLAYEETVLPYVHLCSKSCDPISNIGCPEGFACMIYQESGGLNRFLSDCDPHAGEGRDSDPCSGDAECAPGFFCMPGLGQCIRYCTYPTGYCVVGTCNAFEPHVLLGSTEYGYCWE
ncbi:MAG: DUF4215 domain-containing protein [Pseudomonadota bacterium]